MRNHIFISIITLFFAHGQASAQAKISGLVRDRVSGEVLIGASVFDPGSMNGTATDNNGYFSLSLNQGADSLLVTYVGYSTSVIPMHEMQDSILDIFLEPGASIDEVRVSAFRKQTFNRSELTSEQLRNIPSIGAQPDILKTLQLLPGIQSPNEGSSNLLIRGGGPGQNLFLIDNVSLFYVNHLGGFLSVFNPDVINDVTVMKGGFPAKHGGRLSSVVDITLREGSKKKFKGSGGIGLLGADLTMEGPIGEKISYLVSARKTFTELLSAAVLFLQDEDYIFTYGFYDLNGKLTWRPNYRNSVQANFFAGDDQMNSYLVGSEDKMNFKNRWGNVLGSVQWKTNPVAKLNINSTVSFARYRVQDLRAQELKLSEDSTLVYRNNFISRVSDFTVKSDVRYRIMPSWSVDAGIKSSLLSYIPNDTWESFGEEVVTNPETIIGLESAVYLENRLQLGDRLNINLGMRAVHYSTLDYNDFSFEPRADATLNLSRNHLLNISYMEGSQYTHLITSAGDFLNNEVWVPTRAGMAPSKVRQLTVGWKGHLFDGMMTANVDLYTKQMTDLVAYREGYSSLRGDTHWQSKLIEGGAGLSRGAEFFISKDKGTYTGFVGYTYSHTTRQFDAINNGLEYLYEYDRPHSFSVDVNRKISGRFTLNALWVYQSGLPYTPAIGRQLLPNSEGHDISYDEEVLIYGERNSERMRPYHRLDLSLSFNTKTIKGRDETWTFSIYNLYNRRNPYLYYYNTEPDLFYSGSEPFSKLKLYQFSFLPIVPTVSYKVYF
jgi:hypothetical protein